MEQDVSNDSPPVSVVESETKEVFAGMENEKLKARLRSLLRQRDMLALERDSLELFDLREEVEAEIRELEDILRKSA